jgi:hypothetical protein
MPIYPTRINHTPTLRPGAPTKLDPAVERKRFVSAATYEREDAKTWHERADRISSVDTRMAARMRDIARALDDYVTLCNDIRKTEGP